MAPTGVHAVDGDQKAERMRGHNWLRHSALARVALAGAALVGAVLGPVLLASPASAHIDVDADKAQAGATEVTVSFSAEAESTKAGITSIRVVLAPGLPPEQVSLANGPSGWTLSPSADGYTVAGPALPTGTDAEYAVKIAKLPTDATTLPFKTLVTYANGQVDRWIEIPRAGVRSDNPAPVLTLAPAAAAPGTPGTSPATSTAPTPSATLSSAAAAPPSSTSGDGPPGWLWFLLGAAVLFAAAGGYAGWLVQRRTRTTRQDQD